MEAQMNMYDMAKQLVENETPLDAISLNKEYIRIAEEMLSNNNTKFFFLICPDNRQYVMLQITENSTVDTIRQNLTKIFQNRGTVFFIDKEKFGIVEFWVKDIFTGENYMYQLTPYEVVEV